MHDLHGLRLFPLRLTGGGRMGRPEREVDRRLGDAWSGWKGSSGAAERDSRSPKRLFLLSALILVLLAGLALGAGFYLLEPRLRQWGRGWVTASACLVAAVWSAGLLLYAGLVAGLSAKPFSRLSRVLPRDLPRIFFRPSIRVFSRWLGGTPDRLAHSYIRVHNAWEERFGAPVPADRILVLLPRCLSAPLMERMKDVCRRSGVRSMVSSGGEAARTAVRETRPGAVVGVACERDLLSGIRDLHPRVRVVGIPNRRPEGPCKNTEADSEELGKILSRLIRKNGNASEKPT
jgi:uncharacterized protein